MVNESPGPIPSDCWNIDEESGHPTAEDKHFAEPVVHDGHVM